jgi:hypothetical protein
MQHPNAIMATSSADRISSDGTYQRYQNFRVQTQGGNIIQGQLNKIRVGEILFPYDIPTIIAGRNDVLPITVVTVDGATGTASVQTLTITIPPAFYTSTELAVVINTLLVGDLADLTVAVDSISGAFYFANSGTWNAAADNYLYIPQPISQTGSSVYTSPCLLWTLGFRNIITEVGAIGWVPQVPLTAITSYVVLVPSAYPNVAPNPIVPAGHLYQAIVATPYLGLYTQYIDLCSPALCQSQYVRDGNTQQSVIHRDIICRLYIANEVSMFQTDPTGTRPFVIHRQFKNAKVMKWNVDRSIDAIDIQLFDQWGLEIPNSAVIQQIDDLDTITQPIGFSGARDFAITFLVDEPGAAEQEQNVGYRF